MLRKLLSVAVLLAMPCVSYGAESPADDVSAPDGFRIVLDPGLQRLDDPRQAAVLNAWLGYALAHIAAYKELGAEGRKNPAFADYEIELLSRRALAMAWATQRASGDAVANAYLDKLVEIDEAGFMEEYVLYFFLQPGWTVAPASLALIDFDAFAQWGNANLGGVEHLTLATAEPTLGDVPQVSAQPGAGLVDPEQYKPPAVSCSVSAEALNAAGKQWTEESKLLDGAPIAAPDRSEFIFVLNKQRAMEPWRDQGMTWVSAKPGTMAYLLGFCAVEDYNLLDAEWWLRIAMALRPLDAGLQGELIHVMTLERRYDEADALIDQVMATATDGCDLAGAQRRRGYIRFEQGRMQDARTAYVESLEHDPGNRLALAELQLIDDILREANPDAGLASPVSDTRLSVCETP